MIYFNVFISAGKLVTTVMISCTILVIALPVPFIVSNFVVANELFANDQTVATYHFDENKSHQVEEQLKQDIQDSEQNTAT